MSIADNLAAVDERIRRACERSGRKRSDVTLVVVSKTFPPSAVDEAIAAGATHIGENRVQEWRDKQPDVRGTATWHLIGHLQTNKAKDAARLFDMVESVDSLALAQKLSSAAAAQNRQLDVLLQVNIGNEPQKSGVEAGDVMALSEQVAKLPALRLRGLMTIPPLAEGEDVRPYFARMRQLFDTLRPEFPTCDVLSMGMSDDYEVAIEEGSTMIRVGRAIFGKRD